MKKKSLVIIVILISIMIAISVLFLTNTKNNSKIFGKAYEADYIEIPEEDQDVIITNYQNFIKYFNKYANYGYLVGNTKNNCNQELIDTYKEEFFENKNLAVSYQEVGSSAIVIKYKKCKIEEKVANITYEQIVPYGEMTADLNGYFVIAEIPKEVTTIVTNEIKKESNIGEKIMFEDAIFIANIFTLKNVLIYLLMINLIGFLMMWSDKRRAKWGKWRIPEQTLFIVTALGGGIGTIACMYTFRHKTKKLKFVIGLPTLVVLEIILVIYLKFM